MDEIQTFPKCFELYISQYAFNDRNEVYTDGANLISVFNVIQGWEYYTQQIRDRHLKEISARDKTIAEMYNLVVKFLPDWAKLDVQTVQKLNSIYKDIEKYGLDSKIC